jgi:hypothetical protein
MRRLRLLILASTFLLIGCATIQAQQAELAKWQGLADRATAHFNVGPVRVALIANRTTGQYQRRSRTVELGTDNAPLAMEWLLAHELSHHILGHAGADLRQEMEANAMGVRVLQAWGSSEADAVRRAERSLLAVAKRGSVLTGIGHDWCAEYHDIVRLYSQYPAPNGSEVCTR